MNPESMVEIAKPEQSKPACESIFEKKQAMKTINQNNEKTVQEFGVKDKSILARQTENKNCDVEF